MKILIYRWDKNFKENRSARIDPAHAEIRLQKKIMCTVLIRSVLALSFL